MRTHNFWSVADCSLVKQKCRKQKKAACMADLLLCIICPYNSELKIGWPNVKPFWWTDPSKRLQKRLTRLSIANWLSKINEILHSGQNLKFFLSTYLLVRNISIAVMIFYSIFPNVMLPLALCDTWILQTVSTSRQRLKYGKLTNSWNEQYKIVPSGIQHWSLALQIEHREHWRWMMIFPFNLLYPWSPDWKKRGSPTLLAEVNWWLTGRKPKSDVIP